MSSCWKKKGLPVPVHAFMRVYKWMLVNAHVFDFCTWGAILCVHGCYVHMCAVTFCHTRQLRVTNKNHSICLTPGCVEDRLHTPCTALHCGAQEKLSHMSHVTTIVGYIFRLNVWLQIPPCSIYWTSINFVSNGILIILFCSLLKLYINVIENV